MKCPKCEIENNDSAKFCKQCGTPLEAKEFSHESVMNSINDEKPGDNRIKIVIVVLIVVAIVLAGAFIYLNMGTNNHSNDSQPQNVSDTNDDKPTQAVAQQEEEPEPATTQTTQQAKPSDMSIMGGTFSTGSGLQDKTYASIYVGPEHSGENVKVQIWYSRDGSTLNNGNMVPKTVDSSGYIDVRSADAYEYYPDFAEINLYDSSGNLMDTQSVSLSPTSGTQSF